MWYVDSGCTSHMTGRRDLLSNYVEERVGTLKFGDRQGGRIRGYFTVTNGTITINKVTFIEGLDHNLLSSSQFSENGYLVTTFVIGCSINNEDGKEIIHGKRCSGLYAVDFRVIQCKEKISLLSMASKEDSWLWHPRLSIQNFKDINKLVNKELVVGMPELRLGKDAPCYACEQEKIKKRSHKANVDTNCSSPLDMIHMDLCGPM